MNKRYSLTTNWQFTLDTETSDMSRIPAKTFPKGKWLPAEVPGTIHTDLMANGLLEDPFYRDNELKVQWVDKVDWLYRTDFEIPEDLLEMDSVQLAVDGLDTLADIYLNGHFVAQTENMHIAFRFEVKQYLQTGKNELRVKFHSPTLRAKSLEGTYGRICNTHAPHRLYMRKAQYSFGWDWGPCLPTSGIWKPIYLEAFRAARLANVFVEPEIEHSLETATLQIRIETEWFEEKPSDLVALVEFDGRNETVPIKHGQESLCLKIDKPELWWPVGYGEQKLHEVTVRLLQKGQELDHVNSRFAFRRVELIQEKDAWGKSFYFKINNVPIFCKGANWIPADSFLPRVDKEKYRKLLKMAADSNMNMLRVWGGGTYEQDVFYDLCDEMGLLVWQDFMFACGGYPDHDEYKENISAEIEHVVKRLRNHPGIVLWCGNNENEWIWHNTNGDSYRNLPGFELFHDLIPNILTNLDPNRPYWPSSPFGGENPNSQNQGNRHQWDVWSNWVDFPQVHYDKSRFVTEFGFQASANLTTLEEVTLLEDRDPQSEIIEFHNKQVEGQERLFRFLAGHVKMPESFEDFIFKTQFLQGEALKTCIEHWRRNKFRTAGSIIWQLNDCWPVTSWSLIDSALRPKAAYFYVRRAFKPILVSFFQQGENAEIWVTNDTLESCTALLKVTGLSFYGASCFEEELPVIVPANCSKKIHELNSLQKMDASASYLKAELLIDGKLESETRFFFKRIKHLKLPAPSIENRVFQTGPGTAILELNSSCFAKSVCITTAYAMELRDNWFDLDANTVRQIEVTLLEKRELKEADILLMSLGT